MATKKAIEAQVEEPTPTEPSPADPEPIVIVQKVYTDNGVNAIVGGIQGKVEPTEVQTLLELAVKSWRGQIGLGA